MTVFDGGLRGTVIVTGIALLGAFLAYKLSLVVRYGLADIYAAPAISYLARTEDLETGLTFEEWEAIESNLRQAVSLAPLNPDYLSNLGYLHQMKLDAEQSTLDVDSTQDGLNILEEQNALDLKELARYVDLTYEYYESAASVRPTWPYDWGNLAVEKYRMAQYGSDAYNRALSLTARFGPWKDDAQLLVAELGVDTWEFLGAEARTAVLGTIDRALQRQPTEVIAILNAYEASENLCRYAASVEFRVSPGIATGSPRGQQDRNLILLDEHCAQYPPKAVVPLEE